MKKQEEKLEKSKPPETGLTPRSRKRKAKSETWEGLGMKCKVSKLSNSIRVKDTLSIGAAITDKAYNKEQLLLKESRTAENIRNYKSNLFDPDRQYIMGNHSVDQEIYTRVIRKRFKIKSMNYLSLSHTLASSLMLSNFSSDGVSKSTSSLSSLTSQVSAVCRE